MRTSLHTAVTRALVVLALTCGDGNSPAEAARLPEWARALLSTAPPVPEGVAREPVRVLFWERKSVASPDGSVRETLRVANQSLSQTDDRAGVLNRWFEPNDRIISSRAWHAAPGEGVEKVGKRDAIDLTIADAFITDAKLRLLAVDGVKRGSLVFFEFEIEHAPYVLALNETFWFAGPADHVRFELAVPEGWDVIWDWTVGARQAPVVSGQAWVWEQHAIPAFEDPEPMSGPPGDGPPTLVVGLIPPGGKAGPRVGLRTWGELAAWYAAMLPEVERLTPPIERISAELAAGETQGAELVVSAARLVRDRVRYVAKAVGIGSIVPRPASETLDTLWGDCKDKATLLRVLLRKAGVRAYPVIVNLTERRSVSERVPSVASFNHVVTAIELTPELAPAFADAPAVLDDPKLGKLLIVDTTNEFSSIGSISATLAGKRALLVREDGGELITLPGLIGRAHSVERTITVKLAGEGAEFARDSRFRGEVAEHTRASLRESSTDREQGVCRAVKETWVDAVCGDYQAQAETADGAMTDHLTWRVPALTKDGAELLLPLFPGARQWVDRVSLTKRKTPVVFWTPLRVAYRTVVEEIPAGTRTPLARTVAGDGWSVKTDYRIDGKRLEASYEMVLDRIEFPVEAFGELRKFYSAAGAQADASLDLPK